MDRTRGEGVDWSDAGEVTAATKMRPGKMAAAKMPMTATEVSVTAAEVHVTAAVTTAMAATVAAAMTATMASSASRQCDAAGRQGDGDNERNKSHTEFRHRKPPSSDPDITLNLRQRDARQPGSRG
jgi:hypothetical protein